jgi:DNA primase
MKFFEKYYDNVDFSRGGEVKVLCPFHNDTEPSASVNVEKSLFRCNACGEGHSEASFLAKINGISISEATKVLSKLGNAATSNWGIIEKAELWADRQFLDSVRSLGLSDKTIDDMNLGLTTFRGKKMLAIPVYYGGALLDIRRYNLLKHNDIPKMIGNEGTETGMAIPFDMWKKNKETTYVFEGEKDMLIARELGLNAITLTGGASATPNDLILPEFKDRDVIVCYDNDEAGRNGMQGIYKAIHKIAKSVKYIDISEVVSEEKEDFYDAVHKYNLDAFTFTLLTTHDFEPIVEEKETYISIKKALDRNILKQPLRSVVNVSAEYVDTYALPIHVRLEKVAESSSEAKNTIPIGDSVEWIYDKKDKPQQLLELVEADANKNKINLRLKSFAGIPPEEFGIATRVLSYETVYKVKIIDTSSTVGELATDENNNISLDLYSFSKMDAGHEYDIEYTIYPHPNKHQKVVAIATKVEPVNAEKSFVTNKTLLSKLKTSGTVADRLDYLYQSAKHHIAKHLNFNMWLMMDLVFNSVLEINYGMDTWGALDVFILGDTSTGKSETAKGLNKLYNFGHFVSLKNATTTGLIGGSKKDGENMLNTIGAIPRQHRKLVILEEFSGADPSFIKTMTDIRTSRRVHIVRVAGELDVPCNLRMITISNPIGDERGLPKFLSTFPNGVMPLMELINNPEDVGRYDGFFLMPSIEHRFNPFLVTLKGKPIPEEAYHHKAQWVFTRKKENVIWEDGIQAYIWEQAHRLNEMFESNFPLFGTKSALKLARFSVALASLLLNVDDSFENIIVTKEIVDYMTDFLIKNYDNETFKLGEYKKEYDSYNICEDKDVSELQKIYPKNANLIDYLDRTSVTTLDNLKANSGLDGKDFNVLYAQLSQLKFIRSLGRSLTPTTKFRKAYKKIDKNAKTVAGIIAEGKVFRM